MVGEWVFHPTNLGRVVVLKCDILFCPGH